MTGGIVTFIFNRFYKKDLEEKYMRIISGVDEMKQEMDEVKQNLKSGDVAVAFNKK